MLKILLPILALLLLPNSLTPSNKWASSILTLQTLTLMSFSFLPAYSFSYMLNFCTNLDLMSATLILLTCWVTSLMYIASFKLLTTKLNPLKFNLLLLVLCSILIISFSSSNLFLFYIMFEASLIPTLLLILGWGYQPERLQAGNYLMMYTISASLPLLASLLYINSLSGHLNIALPYWEGISQPVTSHLWWFITILAFLVKTPMYLTHLWLPKAHVEAPVAGSMVLAGMLLKLGTYGFMRISQFFTFLNINILPLVSSISLIGALIAGLICTRQTDIKSLIAYSSVSHMGLATAGIFSGSLWGWHGALVMMLAHGLCSSCMFSLANMMYESTNSRGMYITKGVMMLFPHMTFWWFLFSACNMAAPPSINLLGEILLISSIVASAASTAPLLASISFMAAAYSLYLYTSTNHGPALMFSNPLSLLIPRNYSICLLHFTPLIALIFSPNLITCLL